MALDFDASASVVIENRPLVISPLSVVVVVDCVSVRRRWKQIDYLLPCTHRFGPVPPRTHPPRFYPLSAINRPDDTRPHCMQIRRRAAAVKSCPVACRSSTADNRVNLSKRRPRRRFYCLLRPITSRVPPSIPGTRPARIGGCYASPLVISFIKIGLFDCYEKVGRQGNQLVGKSLLNSSEAPKFFILRPFSVFLLITRFSRFKSYARRKMMSKKKNDYTIKNSIQKHDVKIIDNTKFMEIGNVTNLTILSIPFSNRLGRIRPGG